MPNFPKSTGFKMKGSPHKMGSIQGTSSHASALKQTEQLSTIEVKNPRVLTNDEPKMKPIEASKTYDEVQEEIATEKLSPRKKRRKERRDLRKEYRKDRKAERKEHREMIKGASKEDKKAAREVARDERRAHRASYKKERKELKNKQKEEKSSKGANVEGTDVQNQKRTKEQRSIDIRNTIAEIDSIIPSQFGGGRGVYAVQKTGDEGPSIDNKKGFSKNNKVSPEGSPDDNKGNIKTTDNTTDDIKKANPKNNTSTAEEINNQKKNKNKGSGPDWSTAPAVGSKARATWYKKHNLALDRTTPGGPKK
jgi:hypothetical protein